jgi:hypothetical protein
MKCKKWNLVVLFVAVCVSPSFASLSSYVNLPGLSFGMDSYQQLDGDMTFAASLSTLDQISRASVGISQDTSNPNQGWVSINFSGTVGEAVAQKDWENLSFYLNCRGIRASNNIGIGAYQEYNWVDGTPIYGNWMSNANGSVTLSGVTPLYSTGGYDEYTYNDGGKGDVSIENLVTNFNAWAQFRVQFDSPTVAAIYGGMSPIEMSSVPEPATLCFLGLGAIAAIRRRKSNK